MRLAAGRYVDEATTGAETLAAGPPPRPPSDPAASARRRRWAGAGLLVVVAFGSALAGAAWTSRPVEPDPRARAVEETVAAYHAAWAAGDAAAALRLLTSDATFTGNGVLGGDATPLAGDALSEHVRDVLRWGDFVLERTAPAEVRLDGAAATVTVPNRLGYRSGPGDTAIPASVTGESVLTLRDYGGAWRVTSDTWVESGFLGRSTRHPPSLPATRTCPRGSAPDRPGPEQPDPGVVTAAMTGDGVLVALVGDRTWRLDLCTNRWSVSRSARSPLSARLGLTSAVTRDGTGIIVAVDSSNGIPWTYLPADDAWTTWTSAATLWDPFADLLLAFDPRGGVVMALDRQWLEGSSRWWAYDPSGPLWHRFGESATDPSATDSSDDAGGAGPAREAAPASLVYSDAVDRFVVLVSDAPTWGVTERSLHTWLFDPRTRRWREGSVSPLAPSWGWTSTGTTAAVDPVTGRVVASDGRRVAVYDVVADRWTTLSAASLPAEVRTGRAIITVLAPDEVNDRVVAVAASVGPDQWWSGPALVWGVDVAAARWIRLS